MRIIKIEKKDTTLLETVKKDLRRTLEVDNVCGDDEILQQIKSLQEETGMTILLVSHSMEDVAEYVDRIIVMNKGSVMYDDTPKEVFKNYKELEEVGLSAPQVTYIMHALKEKGLNVNTTATTIEEAAEEIWKKLG